MGHGGRGVSHRASRRGHEPQGGAGDRWEGGMSYEASRGHDPGAGV